MKDGRDKRARTVYFPLHDFLLAEHLERVTLARGVTLHRRAPDLHEAQLKELGRQERIDIKSRIAHWLAVRGPRRSHSSSSVANNWIFALWLVRPTRASLHHSFGVFDTGTETSFARMLTRVVHNRFDYQPGPFTKDELRQAIQKFRGLMRIGSNSRLGLALSLSVESTWVHRWSPGILLAASAVESMLTFTTNHGGATARLKTAFPGLMGSKAKERDAALLRIERAYGKRSEIVHGRHSSPTSAGRLKDLAAWSQILRDLWNQVLARPDLLEALQGDDATRKCFFQSVGAARS
jgi:hypothetical protein